MKTGNSGGRLAAVVFVVVLALAPEAFAGEAAYDDARVIHVEPVMESVTVPSRSVECAADRPAEGGDLRDSDASLDLVTAIRAEAARPAREGRCIERIDQRTEERVVGYRVRYRYAGDDYEQVVDEHPGERIRVRVSVSPER